MENLNIKYTGVNNVEILSNKIPRVVIDLEAYKKMCYIVKMSNKEVGWLGFVEREGNTLLVQDVYLFRQQVGATTCEITPEGIDEMITELLQKEHGDYIVENLKLWGHSHVNMGTTPSSQDVLQLSQFEDNGNDWFLGVIVNKKGSFNFTYIDYVNGIKVNNLSWTVYIPSFNDDCLEKALQKEIKEKVTDLPGVVQQKWWEQDKPKVLKPIAPNQQENKLAAGEFNNIINRYGDKIEVDDEYEFDPYGDEADEEAVEEEMFEMAVEYFEEAWKNSKAKVIKLTKDLLKQQGFNYNMKDLNKILTPFSINDYANAYFNTQYLSNGQIVTEEKLIREEIIAMAKENNFIKPTEKFLDIAVRFTMDIMRELNIGTTIYDILIQETYYTI